MKTNKEKLAEIDAVLAEGYAGSEELKKLRKRLYRIDTSWEFQSENKMEKAMLLQCIKEFLND